MEESQNDGFPLLLWEGIQGCLERPLIVPFLQGLTRIPWSPVKVIGSTSRYEDFHPFPLSLSGAVDVSTVVLCDPVQPPGECALSSERTSFLIDQHPNSLDEVFFLVFRLSKGTADGRDDPAIVPNDLREVLMVADPESLAVNH